MSIKTSWQELVDKGLWNRFCEVRGIDGLDLSTNIDKEITISLSEKEVKKIDILGDKLNVSE